MPLAYADKIREKPGVRQACASRWAGFKVPGKDNLFFQSFGIEEQPFIAMHHELEAPEDQKAAYLADDHGAWVSQELARQLGWQLGDHVVLESRQYPGKWELNISGIYTPKRDGFAQRSIWIHYAYFNRSLPLDEQNKVGMISAQIFEPNQGGRIASEIDAGFDGAQFQTLSLEDHVLAEANIGSFRAILTALDVVSYLILAVVMSIVGNTLAMNVRERTHEYGVMRAIGFRQGHLGLLVLAEAALLGLLGAGIGLCISYPLFENVVSRILQDSMNFPPIKIPTRVSVLALALGGLLSVLAALAPVYRLGQLRVTDALRRLG
jgi:putative ABC transport system permease protein